MPERNEEWIFPKASGIICNFPLKHGVIAIYTDIFDGDQ